MMPAATRRLVVTVALGVLSGCGSTGSSSSGPVTSSTPGPASSSTQARPAPAPRRPSVGPLQTIQRYWQAVAAQNYEAASRYFAPGAVPQNAAEFALQEQQAQIQTASFRGRLASASGSGATVTVGSLTITDGQFGCRHGAAHISSFLCPASGCLRARASHLPRASPRSPRWRPIPGRPTLPALTRAPPQSKGQAPQATQKTHNSAPRTRASPTSLTATGPSSSVSTANGATRADCQITVENRDRRPPIAVHLLTRSR